MKKLLIVFGVLGIFFVGNISAQEESVCAPYNELSVLCEKAIEAKKNVNRWREYEYGDIKLDGNEDEKDSEIKIKKMMSEAAHSAAERTYFKGLANLAEALIKGGEYSALKNEKLFIEATNYFEKAIKLERKPVIHSGGILPGPGQEEDGTDYMANKFLTKFINGSVIFLFSIGVIMLIVGGLMFLLSAGDSEQLTKARDTIFWGIVGIIIAVMSYAIVKFVVGLDFGL